jgi:hypothetical protein
VFVGVMPTLEFRGWNGPQHDARPRMKVMTLKEALDTEFDTDAMMTMYAPADGSRIHRVNNAGVPIYPKELYVSVFFADYDNEPHESWKKLNRDPRASMVEWKKIPMLSTAGIHTTLRGARIIQPLATPLRLAEANDYFQLWLAQLKEAGLTLDKSCDRSGRVWRAARVTRRDPESGALVRYEPIFDLFDMRPIVPEPPAPKAGSSEQGKRSRRDQTPRPVRFDPISDPGELWARRAVVIAHAVKQVSAEWHSLFLVLAGALLDKGAPPSRLVAICEAIARETGADTRIEDRRASAATTLERHYAALSTVGFTKLAAEHHAVAIALDASLAINTEDDLHRWRLSIAAPDLPTADDVATQIASLLENLDARLTLIASPPGTAKTRTATDVAIKRALTPYKSPDARGLRAPPHSKTTIFVDKHEIGRELQAHIQGQGATVRRLFGPLSLRNSDGTPVCHYHDVAQHLVAGGQSMQHVLCEGQNLGRCEHYDSCPAREGAEGPSNARILIAPHALMKKVGPSDLTFIDEHAAVLVTETFTAEDFEVTRVSLSDFVWRFAAGMRPALDAFEAWLREEKDTTTVRSVQDIVASHGSHVSAEDLRFARVQTGVESDDVVAFAKAVAIDPDGRICDVPPLDHRVAMHRLRGNLQASRRIGRASRLLKTLLHVLTTDSKVCVKVDEEGPRCASFTFQNEPLRRVLRESGAVAILDANAASHLPMYEALVSYPPVVHVLEARDAANVDRSHLRMTSAKRTDWFDGKQLLVNDPLVRAVSDAMHWAGEDPSTRSLAIITMKAVEVALRAARAPNDREVEKEWAALRQTPEALARARERLGHIMQAWQGEILFAHYGAVRGRNDLQHVDALITLGDPRPNLGDVAIEAAFAGYNKSARALANERCANELEQAQGRLRTVRRTRPSRALHVGAIRPAGRAWEQGVLERQARHGPVPGPPKSGAMDKFELTEVIARHGTVRATARKVGCSHVALLRCMSGERDISVELAAKLRAA